MSANLKSDRLVNAFAAVPREAFLGRPPWHILGDRAAVRGYVKTANPAHLNHNVLVAIDPKRTLNNGLPSFLAFLIELLEIRKGDTVYHVGCGTGYYSAIMAELTGRSGRVVALEVDKALALKARRNLVSYPQVEVLGVDGFAHNPGPVDAILVNAGVTHLSRIWLDVLKAKGRIVVPLTSSDKGGRILKATRNGSNWTAGLVGHVGIYPCLGGRSSSAEARLNKALAGGDADQVRSLRLIRHQRNRYCWLHTREFCLSRRRP